ncbi:response regulator transcription factor [Guyparkeria halophila]|uniref:Response regulator transcription factor n=1 Tax=Guyparkeria halophila TaxID=47960 RepID=A0ABZ0YYX0_9GAMM|nr:response regulator transcription factor [Guyparkeria halophila]WQH17228.1 response regulator transcription factor [Guyparkeria halophila]
MVDSTQSLGGLIQSEPAAGLTVAWVLTGLPAWERVIEGLVDQRASVIAMSRQPDMNEFRTALGHGARGYVHAVSPPDLLTQAAQAVLSGGMWLPAEVVNGVVRVLSTSLDGDADVTRAGDTLLASLTERESAVAEAVASGLSNKEVARRLEITERTVKAHLGSAFRKLGVRDRMQLMVRLRMATEGKRDVG